MVCALLEDLTGVAADLISGTTSRRKELVLRGIGTAAAAERLPG